MRRFYQESWQGIQFTAFSHTSFFHLADSKFYSTFYESLFRTYKDWTDLPAHWRAGKTRDAEWLKSQIQRLKASQNLEPKQNLETIQNLDNKQSLETDSVEQIDQADQAAQASQINASVRVNADTNADAVFRVLCIGSGVGFMEKEVLRLLPEIELHINEPSTAGMRWLRALIPAERIYIGFSPACLPAEVHYNLVYLSAVDYGMQQADLELLLRELRVLLVPNGELICLSASLLQEDSLAGRLVNGIKTLIRGILHFSGLRHQQFWGWSRTQQEYLDLLKKAGFNQVQDGHLDDGFDTYWISGKK